MVCIVNPALPVYVHKEIREITATVPLILRGATLRGVAGRGGLITPRGVVCRTPAVSASVAKGKPGQITCEGLAPLRATTSRSTGGRPQVPPTQTCEEVETGRKASLWMTYHLRVVSGALVAWWAIDK